MLIGLLLIPRFYQRLPIFVKITNRLKALFYKGLAAQQTIDSISLSGLSYHSWWPAPLDGLQEAPQAVCVRVGEADPVQGNSLAGESFCL
jgi:hypothetical protein